ncbi:MAG: ABC transporter ATP-binding protein [Desulfamplus sp.]|nr:ABC transporter ATP-binding protein [Desulfamplus sp.]
MTLKNTILKVNGLWKSYPQAGPLPITVLKDVDFEIGKGETVAVTGQSGSGKSTLMALMAGLDSPDRGSVVLDGQDINLMNEDQLARFRASHIGIIFQQFHLMPHLTAQENIMLPMEILTMKYDHLGIVRRARELLGMVGLDDRRDHTPAKLSGGECQRVAIARALAVEPLILLADEPTGNLDNSTGEKVADTLFHLVNSCSMTLIVVTHNMKLASRCQRVIKLEKGRCTWEE